MLVELFVGWWNLLWEAVSPALGPMATSFFSVLVGALPFMVIAAFASAVLEVFVSRDAVARLVPRNGLLGVLLAPVAGLVVPMCECGIVPVARRMVQKGVPGAAAVTFMLANPILNPLSIYSTYLAFPNMRYMVWLRIGGGYVVAVLIGLALNAWLRGRPGADLLHASHRPVMAGGEVEMAATADACGCGHEHGHSHDHGHEHSHEGQALGQKVQAVLEHAATEFFDVTKYFVIGSGLAAISQALINRPLLEALGSGPVLSVLVMIAFAFVICICSEADAFVAATFASTFTPGALVGFLVLGPMTDIKNTLMMSSAFQRRTVWFLNAAVFSLTLLLGVAINFWFGWGG